jgi:alpha-ribazole phosphatase
MRVDLLRHGLTASPNAYCGTLDVPLSPHGRDQMEAAVTAQHWDIVYTSPLQRCALMAETFAARLGIACHQDVRLRELHFGDWEGRRADELLVADADALRRFWSDPLANPPPGGESIGALRQRVLSFWDQRIATSPLSRVLVVTHGGPIRILLAQHRRRPLSTLLDLEVPHARLLTLNIDRAGGPSHEPPRPMH